jgi:hypothetical protein
LLTCSQLRELLLSVSNCLKLMATSILDMKMADAISLREGVVGQRLRGALAASSGGFHRSPSFLSTEGPVVADVRGVGMLGSGASMCRYLRRATKTEGKS